MPLIEDGWVYVPQGSVPPDQYAEDEYSEALGSGDISTSPGNPGVTRTFYLLYDRVPAFLDSLLGYSIPGDEGTIERFLPDPHPVYKGMYALEATVQGVGRLDQSVSDPLVSYPVAKVTAVYRSPTYQVLADDEISGSETVGRELERFVTRQYAFGGDYITINSCGMKFVSRDLALNQPPARPTMTMDMTYIWHWVPANPATSQFIPPNLGPIVDCYGRVNDEDFDVGHMNCPAGTVLFMGVDPKLTNYRIVDGEAGDYVFWEIAFKFLYRNNGFIDRVTDSGTIEEYAGHQFIWDQGATATEGRWDLITNDGTITGSRLYQTADLNTLFTIG